MKRGCPFHPKTTLLKRLLGVPLCTAVGILETLWQTVAEHLPQGDIGRWTDEQIAAVVEWQGDAPALIAALVSSGWLDEHDDCRLFIHDWPEHAEDFVHMRLQRAHLTFADGSRPKWGKIPKGEQERLIESRGEPVPTTQLRRTHDVPTDGVQRGSGVPPAPLRSDPSRSNCANVHVYPSGANGDNRSPTADGFRIAAQGGSDGSDGHTYTPTRTIRALSMLQQVDIAKQNRAKASRLVQQISEQGDDPCSIIARCIAEAKAKRVRSVGGYVYRSLKNAAEGVEKSEDPSPAAANSPGAGGDGQEQPT